MSPHAADGAALVAAAVQAAIRERAPRRTVAAVAAAVAGTVMSAASRPTLPVTMPKVQFQNTQSRAEEADDPAQLLESLRAVRRAQRLRKKERRREAKQAAVNSQRLSTSDDQPMADASHENGAADQRAKPEGVLAAVSAPAPQSAPAAASPKQPRGLTLQQLPSHGAEPAFDTLSGRSSEAHTLRAPSEVASAGMRIQGQSATAGRSSPYDAGGGKHSDHRNVK